MTPENIKRADAWRIKHKMYVYKITQCVMGSYEPSLEDAAHPELWKPQHWKWFLTNA